MHSYHLFWEDQDRNREVEVFVDYSVTAGQVQVTGVRPTRVTLYDAQTQQPSRTLGVYTLSGRRLLARLYEQSRAGQLRLEDEIAAHHAGSAESVRA